MYGTKYAGFFLVRSSSQPTKPEPTNIGDNGEPNGQDHGKLNGNSGIYL